MTPRAARAQFAQGLVTPTSGWCPGYTQANVLAVPKEDAFDFLLVAQRNPQPCPVLEVIDAGEVGGEVVGGQRVRDEQWVRRRSRGPRGIPRPRRGAGDVRGVRQHPHGLWVDLTAR